MSAIGPAPEPSPAAGVPDRPMAHQLLARANTIVANPFFAYTAILALQLRVIWRIWDYSDLTPGDTSSYFLLGVSWAHGLRDNIVWSPLYTDFLGTILAVVHGVPTAMMVHRIAIILVAAVLFLAVMRSIVAPALALMIAIWWTVLPANYRVEYEVHLFGLIPVLVAVLILARGRGSVVSRGTALAVIVGTTLLLRNELVIMTLVIGLAIVAAEIRTLRTEGLTSEYIRSRVRWYVIPLGVVVVLAAGAYERSIVQGSTARDTFRAKQTLNFCQVYAFSYQQEHPNLLTGSPWTECGGLIDRTFDRRQLTIFEAAQTNPGAVAHYLGWNAGLLPAGLQVALFGATSGGKNPGFAPVKTHRVYALLLSLLVLAVIAGGLVLIVRDTPYWRLWLRARAWPLLALSGLALTTLYVSLTERPRPDYIYGFVVCAGVLLAVCLTAVARRLELERYLAVVALVALAVLFIPSRFHAGPRPLRAGLERLQVVKHRLEQPGSVLLASGYNYELCSYLAYSYDKTCTGPSWQAVRARLQAGDSLESVLNAEKISVIYADPTLKSDPLLARFLGAPQRDGWRYVATGTGSDGEWAVLARA